VSKIPYPAQFAEATAAYRLIPYLFSQYRIPDSALGGICERAVYDHRAEDKGRSHSDRADAAHVHRDDFDQHVLGAPITCGCYDTVGEPIGWRKIIEDTVLLLFTMQVYFYDRIFIFRSGGLLPA